MYSFLYIAAVHIMYIFIVVVVVELFHVCRVCAEDSSLVRQIDTTITGSF
jgi:hypothetical protein